MIEHVNWKMTVEDNTPTVTPDPALAETGLRYNSGKLRWSLVHFKSLEPMVKVLEFGAEKYTDDNWKKGLNKREILESLQRHLAALMDGETTDKESGQPHIGHILCNAMFFSYFELPENKEKAR